jgi:excisionase family DNA binding protein
MNRALQAFPSSVDTPRAPEPTAPVVVNALGDELLTVNDAAWLLHVTVSWVYEHTRDDTEARLPFVKLGKYVRFDRGGLREYIDAKRQASRSGARRR